MGIPIPLLVVSSTPSLFEYTCHQGNYGMEELLKGARAEEKKSAEKK